MTPIQTAGLGESLAQVAVAAGTLVLVGLLVAFGAFAYKSLRGDGVTWPEDQEEEEGVTRAEDDEEWKYS